MHILQLAFSKLRPPLLLCGEAVVNEVWVRCFGRPHVRWNAHRTLDAHLWRSLRMRDPLVRFLSCYCLLLSGDGNVAPAELI